jgi:hypothetical protein
MNQRVEEEAEQVGGYRERVPMVFIRMENGTI